MKLDTPERVCIGIILVGFSYLVAHEVNKQKAPPQELFAVSIIGNSLVGGSWTGSAPWLWIVDGAHTVVSPIDVLLVVRIVNLQPNPVELDSFSFAIQGNGKWIPLNYIPPGGSELFMGAMKPGPNSFTDAAGLTLSPPDISSLQGKEIGGNKTERFTALFQYSEVPVFVGRQKLEFRITLRDTVGHVSVVETSPEYDDSGGASLESYVIITNSAVLDLSKLKLRNKL